jgi:hypothetical protein
MNSNVGNQVWSSRLGASEHRTLTNRSQYRRSLLLRNLRQSHLALVLLVLVPRVKASKKFAIVRPN